MKMERAKSIEELRIELRRKSLECPVCWEIPKTGPLYQCENGHFLCSACNGKVNLCPVCRVNLPKVRIRNLFAEKQLQKLHLKISKNLKDANIVNGNASKMELALVTTEPKTRVNDPDSVRRNIEAANNDTAQTGLQKCAFVFVIGIGIAVLIIVTFYIKKFK